MEARRDAARGRPGGAAPVAAVREFELTAQEVDWELFPGATVRAWAYNGTVPGPELRVTEGDLVRVVFTNQLAVPTAVHWHGLDVPIAMDGVPGLTQQAVPPGGRFVYEFVATNVGTRWYHSHQDAELQGPLGLYGPLIVEPRAPEPVAYDREVTFVLSEWDLGLTPAVARGEAPAPPGRPDLPLSKQLDYDLFLLNGKAHEAIPPLEVAVRGAGAPAPAQRGEPAAHHALPRAQLPDRGHGRQPGAGGAAADQGLGDAGPLGAGGRGAARHQPGGVDVPLPHGAPHGQRDDDHPALRGRRAPRRGRGAVHAGHAAPAPPRRRSRPGTRVTTWRPPRPARRPRRRAPGRPAATQVVMTDNRFQPGRLTVRAGTTVTWVNRGTNVHTISAQDASFDSGPIGPGESFSFTFARAGEHPLLCRQHLLNGMTGTVVVQ